MIREACEGHHTSYGTCITSLVTWIGIIAGIVDQLILDGMSTFDIDMALADTIDIIREVADAHAIPLKNAIANIKATVPSSLSAASSSKAPQIHDSKRAAAAAPPRKIDSDSDDDEEFTWAFKRHVATKVTAASTSTTTAVTKTSSSSSSGVMEVKVDAKLNDDPYVSRCFSDGKPMNDEMIDVIRGS
jgi:hypothetical protein